MRPREGAARKGRARRKIKLKAIFVFDDSSVLVMLIELSGLSFSGFVSTKVESSTGIFICLHRLHHEACSLTSWSVFRTATPL